MFSTVASVIFRPSLSVLKSVQAVKKDNFDSGPVIGANTSSTSLSVNHTAGRHASCPIVFLLFSPSCLGLQIRRQMREGRDKVGARTSDLHGDSHIVGLPRLV
jgi:hypothetical protein